MNIIPIYSNGDWGTVVAVEVDGVTVRPNDPGPVVQEVREHTFERLDCLPLTVSLNLSFEGLNLWKRLEHNGELPDLTPIPEPDELILAREKRLAVDRLDASFNAWTAAGWDTGLGWRVPLDWSSPILQQLRETANTYQQLISAGAKQPTDAIPIVDMEGTVRVVLAGALLTRAGQLMLIRQTAVERYTIATGEIAAIHTVVDAQNWQPPAWEDPS